MTQGMIRPITVPTKTVTHPAALAQRNLPWMDVRTGSKHNLNMTHTLRASRAGPLLLSRPPPWGMVLVPGPLHFLHR